MNPSLQDSKGDIRHTERWRWIDRQIALYIKRGKNPYVGRGFLFPFCGRINARTGFIVGDGAKILFRFLWLMYSVLEGPGQY